MTDEERQQKKLAVGLVIGFVVLITALALIVFYLLQDSARTSLYRDIMVVLMSLEMLLIFTAAGLLILQVTRLINLTQNEIKPLLEAANETIYTLRGTATFISDSFVEPVIKFNSYVAAIRRMIDLLNFNK
ncbi:hypothetical protein ACFLYP_03005 [Chloroflexota bacterium]